MSSGSQNKDPRYAFSFLSKVPVNEPPPVSPAGALWRELLAYRAVFLHFKFLIKISLSKEIFPFSQRP